MEKTQKDPIRKVTRQAKSGGLWKNSVKNLSLKMESGGMDQ
jgi:hypothetical protein